MNAGKAVAEARNVKTILGWVPLLGVLVAVAGCLPQPIVHKKVKPRPQNPKVDAASLAYTSAIAPELQGEKDVLPAMFLMPTFEERSEREVASEALAQIGLPAVNSLRSDLHNPDLRVRREAIRVLIRMGPDGKEAVPDLVQLLDDADEESRKLAARALGRIGPDAAAAVPALKQMLLEPLTKVPQE